MELLPAYVIAAKLHKLPAFSYTCLR